MSNQSRSLEDWVEVLCASGIEDRDAAARLQPVVEEFARVICNRGGVPARLRFDLVADIWFKLVGPRSQASQPAIYTFDRDKSSFRTWAYRFVTSRLKDLRKAENRSKERMSLTAPDEDGRRPANLAVAGGLSSQQQLQWEEPFSNADLQTIQTWDICDRIVLLTGGGLWHKVPQEYRTQWQEEWGVADIPPAASQASVLKERLGDLYDKVDEKTKKSFQRRWRDKHHRLFKLEALSID